MVSRRKQLLILFISIIFITYGAIYLLVSHNNFLLTTKTVMNISAVLEKDQLFCHNITNEDESLPDISDNPPSKLKRNIFFLETSCNSFKIGKLYIKPRQACAVESAARMNPDMDVYVLFASPGILKDENSESDRMLLLLNSYPNVKFMRFNINKYVEGTPIEHLWLTNKIKSSLYPIAHTSDALRLLTLWKFGGIYLDLDVVVVKSLANLPDNFGGAESTNLIANGVMGFSHYGKGFHYVDQCLNDFAENFDGNQWSFNGPHLVTRNILKHCPLFDKEMLVRFGKCDEFVILPSSAFYLIPYQNWKWFFDKNFTNIIQKTVDESSYMIHLWNKLSFNTTIRKTDVETPYLNFALKYCPAAVQQVDEYF